MIKIATISAAILWATLIQAGAQTLSQGIQTPDKIVPVVTQTLEGVWLFQVQRGGQAVVPVLLTYHPDGTVAGSGADASQTAHHGIWIRVGDRKFLQTMFLFTFNENRVFTGVTKIRINIQVSQDGQSLRGTQEVVVLSPTGQVLATVPGGVATGLRLDPEIPADFYDFQKQP